MGTLTTISVCMSCSSSLFVHKTSKLVQTGTGLGRSVERPPISQLEYPGLFRAPMCRKFPADLLESPRTSAGEFAAV